MDDSRRIMRLEVEGAWSAGELGQLLQGLSDLYDLRLFLELLREDVAAWERYAPEYEAFVPLRRRRRRLGLYWGPSPWWLAIPPLDDVQLSRVHQFIEPGERLEVRRINYASPGIADLAGIGAVVGHLKDFVFRLIERRDTKRGRSLGEERAALENDRLRIENARNYVALGRELGYSEAELRRLVFHVDDRQETIVRLAAQQKIRNVSMVDEG